MAHLPQEEKRWRYPAGIANGLMHLADVGILLGMARLIHRVPPAGHLAKISAGLGCAVWLTLRAGSEALTMGQYTSGGAVVDTARTSFSGAS